MSARVAVALAVGVLLAAPLAARAYSTDEAAAASGREVGFLFRMGFDFGGDRVAEVTKADASTWTINAGERVTFAGGLLYHPREPCAVAATIGYKFEQVAGANGIVRFSRIPIDLIAFWAPGKHRLGGGLTLHLSPTFECRAEGLCDESATMGHALGAIIEYDFALPVGVNSGIELGVRYTRITYDAPRVSLDGSSIGILLGFWL